jgi:peptidyl-prolyl cis-trans isomerase SurA
VGGVIVGFVDPYPPFEEVRPQLEQQAADAAAQAGTALVEEVRSDLDVTVNPRFGVLKEGRLVPDGNGVVDLLEDDPAAAEQAAPAN